MQEFSGQQRIVECMPELQDLIQLMWLRYVASEEEGICRYAKLSLNIMREVSSYYFSEVRQLFVGYDQDQIQVFNATEGHYKTWKRPLSLPSDHLICMISKVSALCLGGYPASNAVYLLNLLRTEVTEAPSMLSIREDPGLIQHKKMVYVFGGFDGKSYLNSCEVFSLSMRQWTPLPDMLKPGCYFPPAVINDEIYLPNYQFVQGFHLPSQAFRLIHLRPYLTSRPLLLAYDGELIFITQEKEVGRFRPSDATEVELQRGVVKTDFPFFAIPISAPVLYDKVAMWVTRSDIKFAKLDLDNWTVSTI